MDKIRTFKGISSMIVLFFTLTGCVGARQTIQIPDYILVPNGKEDVSGKPLTAFIFENNIKNSQIEEYLAAKINSGNYFEREVWITIDKDKYKLIIYDNADFEKYFSSANYSPITEEAKNDSYYSQRKFIAISMINAFNEDCLKDNSLFQNVAVKYLKNLKDEYKSR